MESQQGLTAQEVERRRQAGQSNRAPQSATKTVGQIVRDNICTYFNLVFMVLAVMLALVGSWLNMGFLGIVFCNTIIGIFQQLRAKKTVDELTLVSARRVRCLRGGTWGEQLSEELVKDDVVEFGAGDQIVADAVVLSGTAQANESLLTGEANPITKTAGDALRSGSYLMAGRCVARLTRVGADSYANRLTAAAQADGHKVAKGEMMRSLDKLIRVIGIALIPVGAALLYKQHWVLELSMRSSVESTVAALIGMIPEGLYLLTSVALAVGMMRLAGRRVLTQDMNCIETLARVDVLCVNKTGTITEPTMQAGEPIPLADCPDLNDVLCSCYAGDIPDNDTGRALQKAYGQGKPRWAVGQTIPFNTAYKYSAKTLQGWGMCVVGAPDVLAGARSAEFAPQLTALLDTGCRVLLLARYDGTLAPGDKPDAERLQFLALLPLQNPIRANAPKTFAYFAKQGVQVKVISGDDPRAVSRVAAQAGIAGAENWVDASRLQNDRELASAAAQATVFGRVTPEQKRKLVHALQAQSHTVAMTGDGVNDSPALKKADVGFAMGSGTEVAKEAGDITILDDNFSSIEKAILYGRTMFKSIRKFLIFQLTVNVAAVLTCFLGPMFGENVILTVIQLLLINLAMDTLAAIAFGSEPALKEYMNDKPIPRSASIVSKEMLIEVIISALYITFVCLAILFVSPVRSLFGDVDVTYLKSALFATFMMAITFNGFNARTSHLNPFENLGRNKNFLLVMLSIFVLQFVFVTFGGDVLNVEALNIKSWIICVILAFLVIPIDMIRKGIMGNK